MPRETLLAKAKLTSLELDVLRQRIEEDKAETPPLLQDHYTVAGSLEALAGSIRRAFYLWRTSKDDCSWASILGIFADQICFYVDNYSLGCSYFVMPYTVENGQVTFTGEPEKVDASIVITSLGLKDMNDETQSVAITAPAGTALPAAPTPSVPDDASASGVSIPAPLTAPLAEGGGHSGDEGAVAGDVEATGEEDGLVTKALADSAAGIKQSVAHTDEFLLQSAAYDTRNQPVGYIEQAVATGEGDSKQLAITAIVTRTNIVNSKGQYYSKKLWQGQLDKMNEAAKNGKFIGKVEHPKVEQGLKDAALIWKKFYFQGNDLYAEGVIPATDGGKNLQALIEAGAQIDFSSRGYGTSRKEKVQGREVAWINEDTFECTAFDAVWQGASPGSTLKDAVRQSADIDTGDTTNVSADTTQQVQDIRPDAEKRVDALAAKANFNQARTQLIDEARPLLSQAGIDALQKTLDKATTAADLIQANETSVKFLQDLFPAPTADEALNQAVTYTPNFYTAQSKEDVAPKSPRELIDRMVADVPDTWAGPHINQSAEGKKLGHSFGPKETLRKVMHNMVKHQDAGFNGAAAIMSLLALEQGHVEVAKDILDQALPSGATTAAANADPGGAPLSAPMIFPLIRRVYPRYILGEIASVQPMDRPEGKIFYKDAYRTENSDRDKRIDLNTSANAFNSSYADNSTEGSAVKQIGGKLSSVTIDAHTKKLAATWSIEEMQDLRAYHGLDAATEMLGDTAREMALEWNKEVLDDMIAQATGSARSFLTTAPSGFTQIEWDYYVWNYIQAMSNDIFKVRNGGITHIIAGTDAALALAKGMKYTSSIGDDNGDMELYPGLSIFPIMQTPTGERYRIMKTNFWNSNANAGKILVLRKGAEWSDTAYVWAPYVDFTTPLFTDPSDFSQKQGIMSRAGKKVVVPDAMGVLTVGNGTGIAL